MQVMPKKVTFNYDDKKEGEPRPHVLTLAQKSLQVYLPARSIMSFKVVEKVEHGNSARSCSGQEYNIEVQKKRNKRLNFIISGLKKIQN